ncbi:MAG TPA: lysylphosphatidylglycerol synthase domain-containing protein [Vicinamibacterales bacterium]|nr:lysylphosphatidylglycerol synthase domain-containing protein [Vicinamibacterales bacterium]
MTDAPPPARARRLAVTALASAVGVALLVWQVRKVGLATIRADLAAVGLLGFLAILVLSLLRFVARSAAWITLIGARVPLASTLAATVSGDALGNLTGPLSLVIGEPAKAIYLGHRVSTARGLAALAAENFFYSVSVAIYIVLGTGALLLAFPVDAAIRWAGLTALGAMAAVLAAAGWLAWQKPAAASAILSRVPFVRLGAVVERVRDFEERTYGSVGQQSGRLGFVLACETAFHLLSFVEAWLTLWLLTGASSPLEAFVLDTFSRVSNIAFRVVPLRLGLDQLGSEAVAQAIGVRAGVGTTLSLVRTGRVLVWAIVGVGLLLRRGWTRSPSRP